MDKGVTDRAMADYDAAIRLDSRYAKAFYNRGLAWGGQGDNDRAIADFDAAIRLNPRDAEAFYNRGLTWSNKGDQDRAIADYDTAVRLDPRHAAALNNRGVAWQAKGDHDRALADFDVAIRVDPENATVFANRGLSWAEKADYARAVADYDAAIRLDPADARMFKRRGRAHFYQGQFALAEKDLVETIARKRDIYAVLWLYLARARSGNKAEAQLEKDASALPTKDWPEPVLRLFLGRLSPEGIMSAASASDSQKEKERRCEAHFYVAQWHMIRGEKEHAMPQFRRAREVCPDNFVEYDGAVAELKRLGGSR
jgi:lipoprotein NlpI